MYLQGTKKVMEFLRLKRGQVRINNKRIGEWVGRYVNESAMRGEPVTILSQWCISKDLEARYELQGRKFVPTKNERKLFERSIPQIASVFQENGIEINWVITLNRSCLDSGRIAVSLESAYLEMLEDLASPLIDEGWLLLLNWEDDILEGRPTPDTDVLDSVEDYVSPGALQAEIERHSAWAREDAGLAQSDKELRDDVYYQIACEVKEGGLLCGDKSPFGEFILIPLEMPEQYDFFTIKVPDFKNRIVPVLPPYPWRMNS